MTLAKTCHASNTTQGLEKITYRPIATIKSFLNRDVSMFHCCSVKKLNLNLKLQVVILNE